MNFKEIKLILNQLNFKPKKHLGQNFLIDNNILKKIISISEISKDDTILEIGPGLGALTEKLVDKARKVYAVEINSSLSKYLSEKLSGYDNIEIINEDILKIEIPEHNKVISNIPYTITGPILEKVFFKQNPPPGVLTIERNISNRIFLSRNYKDFSRISIGLNAFMKPTLKFAIPQHSFFPFPRIDLSLIKIIPKENLNPFLLKKKSAAFFLKFVAGIMPYKNKNIVNALLLFFKANRDSYHTKEKILQILQKNNYENKKVFNFKIEEFIELSRLFYS